MEPRRNTIRACMEADRKAMGLHMRFAAPPVIELCADQGLDFVYLDIENGSFELREIEDSCRSAEIAGLTTIARVPRCDPWLIGQVLNLGVQGIIVPHVSTASEAEAAVQACFYPPLGERGYIAGARANRYSSSQADFRDYYAAANAQITLTVQLEDAEALRNCAAIAAVPGITYFTVGKQDLALSMGRERQPTGFDPEVLAAAGQIEAAVRAAGGKMKDDVMMIGRLAEFVRHGIRAMAEK